MTTPPPTRFARPPGGGAGRPAEPDRRHTEPWRWFLLAGLVIVLDQASKLAVGWLLAYGQRIALLPVLDLTLLYNKGAAFSFLSTETGWQRWLFTALALLVSTGIGWLLVAGKARGLAALALTLILGGALGNVIDRVAYGHVVDFILAYYGDHFFPAFNLADSAITIGAVLLVLEELLWKKT